MVEGAAEADAELEMVDDPSWRGLVRPETAQAPLEQPHKGHLMQMAMSMIITGIISVAASEAGDIDLASMWGGALPWACGCPGGGPSGYFGGSDGGGASATGVQQ